MDSQSAAKPLVALFIHGMFPPYSSSEELVAELKQYGCICLAPRLPYHHLPNGRPDPRLGTATLEEYAAAMEQEVRTIREQYHTEPVIIGWSMGGLIAQLVAAHGYGKAVVLVAPAAPNGIGSVTLSNLLAFWNNFLKWKFWNKPGTITYWGWQQGFANRLTPERHKALYADTFPYASTMAALQIADIPFLPWHGPKINPKNFAGKKMLIIVGTEDRLTSPDSIRAMKLFYEKGGAHVQLNIVPSRGHLLLAEDGSKQLIRSIAEWMHQV